MQTKKELKKELDTIKEKKSAQYKRQNSYISAKYDRLSVCVPAGVKDRITAGGFSVNGFVSDAIMDKLKELDL